MNILCDKNTNLQQGHLKHVSETFECIVTRYPHDLISLNGLIMSHCKIYFNKRGTASHDSVHLQIIAALNTFLLQYAHSFLLAVRELAEQITEDLCTIWQQSKTDQLRAEICQFFRLVLRTKISESEVIFSSDSITHIYQTIKFGLNQPRLFSFSSKNMSSRQELLQQEHLYIFFDLAAQIFYEFISRNLLVKKLEESESNEPQAKRRKTLSLPEQIIEKIGSTQTTMTSADNITIHWHSLLLYMLKKYGRKLPIMLLHQSVPAIAACLEQVSTNTYYTTTIQLIGELAKNYNEEADKDEVYATYRDAIFPLLCKYILTETTGIIPQTLAAIHSILTHVDTTLSISPEINKCGSSIYFQESQLCADYSISFAMKVLELQQIHENINFADKEVLLRWACSTFTSVNTSKRLSQDILAKFLVNLTRTGFYIHINSYEAQHQLSLQEQIIDNLKLIQDPLLTEHGSSKTQQVIAPEFDAAQYSDPHFVSVLVDTLLDVARSLVQYRPETAVKEEFSSEVSPKQIDDVLFFILTMLHVLDNYTIDDTLRSTTQDCIHNCLLFCMEKMKSISVQSNYWKPYLRYLTAIFKTMEPTLMTTLFQNSKYVTAIKQLQNVLVDIVRNSLETDLNNSQLSSNASADDIDDDLIMMDSEDVNVSAASIVFRTGTPKKNRKIVIAAIQCLSLIGYKLPVYSQDIFTQIEKKALGHKISVKLHYDILYHCCQMGNFNVCKTALESMPSAVTDHRSYAEILRLIGSIAVCLKSTTSDDIKVSDEFVTVTEKMKKVLGNLYNLYNKNTLDEVARLSLAECLAKCIGLESFKDTALGLKTILCDDSFSIRLVVAKVIPLVGKFYGISFSLFADLWSENLEPLLSKSTEPDDLKPRTSMVALVYYALENAQVEQEVLFHLMRLNSRKDFVDKDFAERLLLYLANKLDYGTVVELLEDHILYLLYRWISDSVIQSFPHSLFGNSTLASFIQQYGSFVLPFIVEKQDRSTLNTVAKLCNAVNAKAVITTHFSCIMAYCSLLYGKDKETGRQAQKFLADELGSEMPQLLATEIDNILVDLFAYASSAEETCNLPFYSQQEVIQTLNRLTQGAKKESVSAFLKEKKGRIHMILYNLHEGLMSTHRLNSRMNYLSSLDTLIVILGTGPNNLLSFCSTIRYIVHIILEASGLSGLSDRSCEILLKVLTLVQQNNDREGIIELGANLPRIVTTLFGLLEQRIGLPVNTHVKNEKHSSNDLEEVKKSKPYSVLWQFISYTHLRSFLRNLDSFTLNHPIVIEFQKVYDSARGTMTLIDQIKLFLRKSGSHGLSQLLDALKSNKIQIPLLLDRNDSEIYTISSQLTSKLVNICRRHYSHTDKSKAGECLGLLGLSVPFFDSNDMHQEYEFETVSVTSWNSQNILLEAKKKILESLNKYLVDKEVHVIRIASETLRQIFSTKSGQESYKYLDPLAQLYLQPFTSKLDSSPRAYSAAYTRFVHKNQYPVKYDRFSNELFTTEGRSHEIWVMNLTSSLITSCTKDEVFKLCGEMCLCKPEFAELLFPLVIYDMSTQIQQKEYQKVLSPLLTAHVVINPKCNPRTIRLLLATLHILLRSTIEIIKVSSVAKVSEQKYKYWLQLPYLKVAEAALRAEAVYTAMLYVEMDCEEDQALQKLPTTLVFEEDAPVQQDLLFRAYRRTNEPDGIFGVNRNYGIHSFLLQSEHEADWDKTLSSYDIAVSHPLGIDNGKAYNGILSSLRNLGYDNTSQTVMNQISNTIAKNNVSVQEQIFENAWRNSCWDQNLKFSSTKPAFHHSMFNSLKALSEGNVKQFWQLHDSAKLSIIRNLTSGTDLFPNLAKLHMLSEVQDAWKIKWGTSLPGDISIYKKPYVPTNDIIGRIIGTKGARINEHSFHYVEPLLALRTVLIKILDRNDLVPIHLCSIAQMARKESQFSLASNILHSLSFMKNHKETMHLWMPEEAKLQWTKGDHNSALNLAQFLRSQLKQQQGINQREAIGRVSCMLGSWLSQSQSESGQVIKMYLDEAVQNCKVPLDQHKAYYALGKYCDSLYSNIIRKMESQEYLLTQEMYRQNKQNYDQAVVFLNNNKADPNSNDIKSYLATLMKSIKQDEMETQKLISNRGIYLLETLKNYGLAAHHGNKHDLSIVFRVCSLWFNNCDDQAVNHHISTIALTQRHILTYKFLPLMYQIASRMGNTTSQFHRVIKNLLFNIAKEHPHHSLLQLFALKNGQRIADDERGAGLHLPDAGKITTALQIIMEYKKIDKELIDQMEQLTEAYIELAFSPVSKDKAKLQTIQFHKNFKIRSVVNLNRLPVSTIDLPAQPAAVYRAVRPNEPVSLSRGEFPSIVGFDESFSLAGGVNLPKIIKCNGSDGQKYRQLVKGRDDLRQDAVMQQIFALVNDLLTSNKETRKRNLRVRTYKVIPLSPTSGLLGWVENTVPLGTYLIGPPGAPLQGAHARYRPTDMSNQEARKKIHELDQKTDLERLNIYNQVCKQVKPVFHHFFTENYPNPADWFAKRLAYTRSVASNSIVGYIIGLGDRHSQNILMDLKSAECVHIDLGVAFDQGAQLPIPERVPFRLTRDIVDGFGVTGVEGTFRSCSEHTMTVLRNNAELLSQVVEVFIHDPLYKWSLSPAHKYNLQREDTSGMRGGRRTIPNIQQQVQQPQPQQQGSSNEAKRVLIRLQEKLKGYEEGEWLSVKGQVNKLIVTAQNTELLSRLFCGWAAFL
jgi:ataxia telangiectasia mutated family protein